MLFATIFYIGSFIFLGISYILYKYFDELVYIYGKHKQIPNEDRFEIKKIYGFDKHNTQILIDHKPFQNIKKYVNHPQVNKLIVIYTWKGKYYNIIYNNNNNKEIRFPPYTAEYLNSHKVTKKTMFLCANDPISKRDYSNELNQLLGPRYNFYEDIGITLKYKTTGLPQLNFMLCHKDGSLEDGILNDDDVLQIIDNKLKKINLY